MSEGSYLKADVMCPFYLSDDRRRVLCEGVMQGAVTVPAVPAAGGPGAVYAAAVLPEVPALPRLCGAHDEI